jgi:hypothetical protein
MDTGNVFVSASCLGSRWVAIKTMCFLKAILEDSDNRALGSRFEHGAPRSFSARQAKRLHGIFCRLPRFCGFGFAHPSETLHGRLVTTLTTKM